MWTAGFIFGGFDSDRSDAAIARATATAASARKRLWLSMDSIADCNPVFFASRIITH
jgi:hypothetical protein